ncbi:C6 transcription factor [Colletotrichum truncatum]|uniref:C6 transcription factor n=1 Tax=Colletotrichum truncatum TaxID=5467 RepID=A0ACC3YHT5_COLTU
MPSQRGISIGGRGRFTYTSPIITKTKLQSLQSYHFLVAPLIKEPPQTPLPDPDQYPEWYGETFLRYPLSRTLVPMHFGHLANSKFRLAVIINSLVGHLFSPTGSTPPASQTISEYLPKLTSWFTSLPKCLGPSEIVFPVQLKLHLGYHNLITNLCELHTDDSSEPIDESTLGTIRAHLSHSRVCFEALLRLYYLRHGFEYADTYLTHELSVLGFRAFENCQNLTSTTDGVSVSPDELSDARSTLILAAKGLNEQGLNYYAPFNILCVLVNQMDAYELDMLRKCVSIRSEDSLGNQFRTTHQGTVPVRDLEYDETPQKAAFG